MMSPNSSIIWPKRWLWPWSAMRPDCRRSSRSRSWLSICCGHLAVARACHVLEIAQHALEVLLRQHLLVGIDALHRLLAVGLPVELIEELRQRLPQLLHQALDLLVRRAVAQRLLQPVLCGAQGALGVGEIAVLDAQRDVPQLRYHAVADGARVLALQAPIGRPQPQEDLQIVDELFAAPA